MNRRFTSKRIFDSHTSLGAGGCQLYVAVGLLLVAISPYVVFYEEQTFFGVGFAVLGFALIADELFRKKDGRTEEEDTEKDEAGDTNNADESTSQSESETDA